MTDKPRITPGLLLSVGTPRDTAFIYAPMLDTARMVEGDGHNSITSRTGIAMLVAQMAHESGGFTQVSENLNYQATALVAVFGAARITPEMASRIGRTGTQKADQEAIANTVYGGPWGRANLGNTEVGDGWRFRGGGPLQLTGRENYARWGATMGLSAEDAAGFVRRPAGGISAALWFWRTNGLINPAYLGDVATCTQIINGGQNGLADRLTRYRAALAFLSA